MKHLIVFLFLITFSISAQNFAVEGYVYTSTGKPLELANISIVATSIGTVTNEEGKFILSGNFKESDLIQISFIGFETKRIPVKNLLSNQNTIIILTNVVITSQTVLVKSSIGQEGLSPMSFSKIKRTEIEEGYVNQDIPELLSYLPSTTFYSEGGSGIGYNYISIRGFDQRRISVAINGISQNDPEDHNVYWVDFPDLLESTELIQVQRGAGAGVIGYPSVGGSINIITSPFSNEPKMEFDVNTGSYNTRKYTASVASGLIDNKYSVYMKLGNLLSSGYREKNWVDLKSYHLSAVRYDENITTQINFYGGPIEDGLTYTGLPKFAVKDRNLRKQNFSYWETEGNKYTYTLDRRKDEVESFSQPHYEILNEFRINEDIIFNSALFLVIGKGYFDYDGSWSVYYDDYFRLNANGYNSDSVPQNALIRAQVENKQWGWIPRLSIKHNSGELIVGGEIRFHKSLHWGGINYAENLPAGLTKDYRYYRYNGGKDIINFYAHEMFNATDKLNLLVEAQIAYHNYKINNERYEGNNFEINNLFFNPRLGVNYKFSQALSSFISFARVSREPRLKTYYDAAESSGGEVPQFEMYEDGSYNFNKPLVKPEVMNSFELGVKYDVQNLSASVNIFYMLFNDEIVKKGQLDRFGQPVTGNIDQTIHSGIEFSLGSKFADIFEIKSNAALSKNYINKGVYFISENQSIDLKDNNISGFPDVTANIILSMNYRGFFAQLSGKYVGAFFSDNYDDNLTDYLVDHPGFVDYYDNKVDAYFTANFLASYRVNMLPVFKTVKIFLQVNNIFDNLYAAYAVGKEYFPAAERHFTAGVNVGL
ncbi:MAG: TonB-dependent receptor [Bacteroidetes bacterium]|nr:TonB-dependent receptor [Bacteroidota bacterium]